MSHNNPITLRLPVGHQTIHLEDYHGRARGKISLGQGETEVDWEARLRRANAAENTCRWFGEFLDDWSKNARAEGDGSSQAARDTAWAAGLRAGLLGEVQVIGGKDGTPESRHAPVWERKGAQAFRYGWRLGDAVRRATEMATRQVDDDLGEDPYKRGYAEGLADAVHACCALEETS